jgi:spermidine synthase
MAQSPQPVFSLWFRVAVAALFFASGASGLMYETAWSRLFQDLFGHGVHTNAAVLAAFMAGLGLGAAVGGRWADRIARPLVVYAVLEIGIVAVVWTSPWQVAWADRLFPAAAQAHGESLGGGLVRWLVAFALVAVPTSLMGATLPVLSRALARSNADIGRAFGTLYGANTLGAVAGVVAAGFWLIRVVGVTATLRIGCAVGVVAAAAALALHVTGRAMRPVETPRTTVAGPWKRRLPVALGLVVFGSGFSVLAYEIAWIRSLVFVLDSNVLSFATVLGTLLFAMGLGSILLPLVVRDRTNHLDALGWVQLCLGVTGAATVLALANLGRVEQAVADVTGIAEPLGSLAGRAALTAVMLTVPGLCMGAALPAATGAIRNLHRSGRRIGVLYGITTAGNIAGSLSAGYLLVPALGATRTVLGLAVLNIGLGVLMLVWTGRVGRRTLIAVAAAAALVVVLIGAFAAPGAAVEMAVQRTPHSRLVSMREGLRGTVTISEVPPMPVMAANARRPPLAPVAFGYRMIAVDGVDVAGTAPDLRTTQRMQAHVPLLLHGEPRRVLQVGFGTGETTREALRHAPEVMDVAEINPDVIMESRRWFPEFASDGYRPIFTDARNFIRTTDRVYDVILNDSTYPGISGSSLLYSATHFANCRRRLAPDGVISTWLPIDLPPESLRIILASFAEVFPSCSLWLPTNCWNKHAVLVGSMAPLGDPVARLAASDWPDEVVASLAELGYDDPELFASMLVLDARDIEALAAGSVLNSDDHPVLEYPARGVEVAGEVYWEESLRLILERMGPPGPPTVTGNPSAAVRRILTGMKALLDGQPDLALTLYRRAQRDAPAHPGPRRLIGDIRTFRAQRALDDGYRAMKADGTPVAAFERAADLAPESALARWEAGRALFEVARFSASIDHLRAAHDLSDGAFPEALLMLGDALRLTERPAEAEAAYREHLETGEETVELMVALAEALIVQGDLEGGTALIERALERQPGFDAAEALLSTIDAVGPAASSEADSE